MRSRVWQERETKFGRNPLQRAEKTENLTQYPAHRASGDPLGWLGCAGTSLGIFARLLKHLTDLLMDLYPIRSYPAHTLIPN